jgi:hypothetical protein
MYIQVNRTFECKILDQGTQIQGVAHENIQSQTYAFVVIRIVRLREALI